jgi:hypothetical protein
MTKYSRTIFSRYSWECAGNCPSGRRVPAARTAQARGANLRLPMGCRVLVPSLQADGAFTCLCLLDYSTSVESMLAYTGQAGQPARKPPGLRAQCAVYGGLQPDLVRRLHGSSATPHPYEFNGPVLSAEEKALFCMLYPTYQKEGGDAGVRFDDMAQCFNIMVLQKWKQDPNNISIYSWKIASQLSAFELQWIKELQVAMHNQRVVLMQEKVQGSGSTPIGQRPGAQAQFPSGPGWCPPRHSGMPFMSPCGSTPAMGQSFRVPVSNSLASF